MKKQDLDALRELYSSVYGGEFLLERRQALPGQSQIEIDRQEAERARQAQATNRALQSGRTIDARLSSGLGATLTGQRGRVALNKKGELEVKDANPNFQLDKTIQFGGKGYNRKTGPDGKVTYVPASNPLRPAAPPRPTGSTTTPTPRPTGSTTRPVASGPVLSKKNGVEGTGVGANFKARAFTDAEKSRYASVAAQNAARTSASSGSSPSSSSSSSTSSASAPKPPTPAIGKLGSTSFERRTPTSAELRAAQAERATQKASGQDTSSVANAEKALQAAQRTNLPTTGPTPAIPDLKSVNADLAKANSPAVINRPAPAGSALAKQQSQQKLKPPTPGTGANMQRQSYEWPSAKTIRDIADAYASIYEAKKNDGNLANNYPPYDEVTYGDVVAGRLGKDEMGGKKKSTKKEDFEFWINSLLDEGYDLSDYTWDDMYEIYVQQLDEGLGSAIKGLFGGRKKPAAPTAPEGRTAQLRRKYGITSRTGPESPRGKILSRAQRQIDADIRKYGEDSTPAKESQAARQKQLEGGYSQFGMNDRRGRGRKARERAKGLQREDYAIYEIVASYLLENNFAETINDANVIIENMSEVWLEEILNNN